MKNVLTLVAVSTVLTGALVPAIGIAQVEEASVDKGPSVVMWGDYDGDGFDDIYLIHPGGEDRLLRNDQGGGFGDVTRAAGVDGHRGSVQAVWADFDRDGRVDLLVVGGAGLVLHRNLGGVFDDVTAQAGLTSVVGPHAVDVRDFDRDGSADLVVSMEHGDDLWHNDGSGRFLPVDLLPLETAAAPARSSVAPGSHDSHVADLTPVADFELAGAPEVGDVGPLIVESSSATPATPTPHTTDRSISGSPPSHAGERSSIITACAPALHDQATASCLEASSAPTLGLLYPLSENLFVDSSGDVGVGTLSPSSRLHVVGDVLVEGRGNFGSANTNTGATSFVAGLNNTASGVVSTVGGGGSNTAAGLGATVGGGTANDVTANVATIGGGNGNTVSAALATVGGGFSNEASGGSSTVGGGYDSVASGTYATVAGGYNNTASGRAAVVGGGGGQSVGAFGNMALGDYATVAGGRNNKAVSQHATIGGGNGNVAGEAGTVAGGRDNAASIACAVGGGDDNSTASSYATIAGGRGNSILPGGYYASIGGGYNNTINKSRATIGGGYDNDNSGFDGTLGGGSGNLIPSGGYGGTIAGGRSNSLGVASDVTIGGGRSNAALASFATVGGGYDNTASGTSSTVPGGYRNIALGNQSFAAGREAAANHAGAFVWGDSQVGVKPSSAADTFNVYASGGATFFSNAAATSGVTLAAGGGSWSSVSDRAAKENVEAVDGRDVLERLAAVPVATWNYKTQDDAVRHMGPMAQDFRAAFGLGVSDRLIDTIDTDGVALAAIQGLRDVVHDIAAEKDAEIVRLEARLAILEARVAELVSVEDLHGD